MTLEQLNRIVAALIRYVAAQESGGRPLELEPDDEAALLEILRRPAEA